MSAPISIGQITIIDLHDAPSLNAWISAEQPASQTYNNTTVTYNPNYVSAPQILTLNLTKAGSIVSLVGNDISNIKWFRTIGGTKIEITATAGEDDIKGGTKHSVLTTKTNIPVANNAIIWEAEGIWTDPITGLPVNFSATITLTLVQLAKAAIIGNVYAPEGDFFRNNMPATLKINADLYKDGVLSGDSKKFKWFAADSSITEPQDADAGVGWRSITATSGSSGECANIGFDVATTAQGVLTVHPDAVTNAQTYLVVITDNAGGTAGTKVKQYFTLRDMDDPIMVIIESTGGNIIKNKIGSTDLIARLYQNGEEIDEGGTIYDYKWTRWQDKVLDPNFGGAGVGLKMGKELAVGSADVDGRTTFKVEVMEK